MQHYSVIEDRVVDLLKEKGIRVSDVDVVRLAKSLVAKAMWKYGARQWEAPLFFDCTSLTKWLYGQKGVWLPRRPVQQYKYLDSLAKIYGLKEAVPSDLLFTSSPFQDGVKSDSTDGIGHVFIVSDEAKAVCATNSEFGTGVVEVSFEDIFKTRKFCGIGKVVCDGVVTLLIPPYRDIETVDDVRCVIEQSLPTK